MIVALAILALTSGPSAGVMVLDVVDQRGTREGWRISLTVSDFTYRGTSPLGQDIPARAFSIVTARGPAYVRGQAIDGNSGPMTPTEGATGSLDGPVVVRVAADGYGGGEYAQAYDVALIVPGGSQVGTYTAVVDVTTSAAP